MHSNHVDPSDEVQSDKKVNYCHDQDKDCAEVSFLISNVTDADKYDNHVQEQSYSWEDRVC